MQDHPPATAYGFRTALIVFTLVVFAAVNIFADPLTSAFTAYLILAMAVITVSDLRHFIIPDAISLPSILVGIAANIMVFGGGWGPGLEESLWGALIGGGSLYLIRAAYFWLRGIEGLGLGDVKLAVVAGVWLGPGLLAPACLMATLSALFAVLMIKLASPGKLSPRLQLPFGAFIAPSILLIWAFRLWEAGIVTL